MELFDVSKWQLVTAKYLSASLFYNAHSLPYSTLATAAVVTADSDDDELAEADIDKAIAKDEGDSSEEDIGMRLNPLKGTEGGDRRGRDTREIASCSHTRQREKQLSGREARLTRRLIRRMRVGSLPPLCLLSPLLITPQCLSPPD